MLCAYNIRETFDNRKIRNFIWLSMAEKTAKGGNDLNFSWGGGGGGEKIEKGENTFQRNVFV